MSDTIDPAKLCHNGHPFEPGQAEDADQPDPLWCNVCGEARQAEPGPLPTDDTRPIDISTAFRTRIRQAIRAADMNSDARSEASWLDEMATAVLGIARDGADDTTGPEGAEANPGQWVALFVDSDGPRRRQLAGRVISNSTAAAACFEGDHVGDLAAMRRQLAGATALHDAAAEALDDLKQQLDTAKNALREIAYGDTAGERQTIARRALDQIK